MGIDIRELLTRSIRGEVDESVLVSGSAVGPNQLEFAESNVPMLLQMLHNFYFAHSNWELICYIKPPYLTQHGVHR